MRQCENCDNFHYEANMHCKGHLDVGGFCALNLNKKRCNAFAERTKEPEITVNEFQPGNLFPTTHTVLLSKAR